MKAFFVAGALALAAPSYGESLWNTIDGRAGSASMASLFGGPRFIGAGVVVLDQADGTQRPATWGLEAGYALFDRNVQARGARTWSLRPRGVFTASGSLGAGVYFIPVKPVDLGLEVFGGATMALGVTQAAWILGAEAGATAFANPGFLRFPARVTTGVAGRAFALKWAVLGRFGVDLSPAAPLTFRAEWVVVLGWVFEQGTPPPAVQSNSERLPP